MSVKREIITLQVGHYSNFIGAHWWNIQESDFVYSQTPDDDENTVELDHDFLFREGKLPNGQVTYTPRVLIVDAKGSLGSLPRAGTLYEPVIPSSALDALWNDNVELIHQLSEEKNDFLKSLEEQDAALYGAKDEDKDICSDETLQEESLKPPAPKQIFDLSTQVNVWTDFLRPHLHSNSIHLLQDVQLLDVSMDSGSWGFQGGASVFKKSETEEDITDRIRLLAESCENLQGFQLLTDGHNGMGGISWSISEHLSDEYKPKTLFSFISTPPHLTTLPMTNTSTFLSSLTQCYTYLSEMSSIVVPFNLKQHAWHLWADPVRWPLLSFGLKSAYKTSSIFGSFLEVASVPYRLRKNPLPMASLAQLLTPYQRKCASASLCLPLGVGEDSSLRNCLEEKNHLELIRSITGGCDYSTDIIAESQVLRGIPTNKINSEQSKGKAKYNNAWTLYEAYLRNVGRISDRSFITGIKNPLKTTSPFPKIFKKEVGNTGCINEGVKQPFKMVSSVPALTGIHQGKGIKNYLEEIYEGATKLHIPKAAKLHEEGIDKELWEETLEDFRSLLSNYGTNLNPDHDTYDDVDD